MGWRTTIDTGPLFEDIEQMLRDQAVIPLPSGQLPPIYSANHRSCFYVNHFALFTDDKNLKLVQCNGQMKHLKRQDHLASLFSTFHLETGRNHISLFPGI